MDAPRRYNTMNTDMYERSLQEAEKTLQDTKLSNEEFLLKLKAQNINALSSLDKKTLAEINKLNISLSNDLLNYKNTLTEKYAKKYAGKIVDINELEKKIAEDTADYLSVLKEKYRKNEYDSEMNDLKELSKAKKKEALVEFQRSQQYFKKESAAKDKYRDKIKEIKKAEQKEQQDIINRMKKDGASDLDILQTTGKLSAGAIKEAVSSKEITNNVANKLLNGLKAMFDNTIQTYGTYQSKINTRLQGSGLSWNGTFGFGGIESTLKAAIGSNPWVKLQSIMDNVVKATEAGIANNIEQRAFLATVSENIAATFDAFDANLLRLIRLQQADSTAARLGMESGITTFLNNYFSDNSYLNGAFDSVSQNLIEATSQLSSEQAVAVEYQVQKWLGSLYSVGFSNTAVSKIAQAIGYLGSGDISALSNDTAMQNLVVMAMNKSNLSYGELLKKGLNESSINSLLRSMVEYLEDIAKSDDNLVKSKYAEVFGMTLSDLKAATNLSSNLDKIYESSMNYSDSMNNLYDQMGQLYKRISVAGMMQNLYDNVNYSIGTSIASNPATYALWQITSAIEDLTGGINLPTVSVMGNAVDLNTTVTNLMRAGIVGVSTLSNIGTMLSQLGGITSTVLPSSMLLKLGIFGSEAKKTTSRGGSLNRRKLSLNTLSGSQYIGNSAGDDYYTQTLTNADYQSDKKIEQKRLESNERSLTDIHEYLLSIFDPKITEIERLMALNAGYGIETKAGNSFSNGTTNYSGTQVSIKYTDSDLNNIKSKSNELLSDISSNTKDIYELLKLVISESGIKIDRNPLAILLSSNGGLV